MTTIINTVTYTSSVLDADDRTVREERSTKLTSARKLTRAQAQRRIRETMDSRAIVTRVEAATAA